MLIALDRSTNTSPKLRLVDQSSVRYDATRRRVILFPGEGVWEHSDARTIAGAIKYVEQTLASSLASGPRPIDIMLSPYEMPYEDYGARKPHYAMDRTRLTHYGRNALDHAVLPALLKSGETLYTLTPEILKERLRHLTLVGHSYGSLVIQDVANALAQKLRGTGNKVWDEATIAATMKELVSVAVAPVARTDYPAPNFTQYFFTSINDMTAINFIRIENPEPQVHIPLIEACGYKTMAHVMWRHDTILPTEQLLEEVRAEVEKSRRPGVIPRALITSQPSGYVLSSLLPDDEIKWMEKRADGTLVDRFLNAQEALRTQTSVVHDYRTYLHGDHKLGDVLINVMNNAVQRDGGIGDGHRLLMNTPQTLHQQSQRSKLHRLAHVSERALA